MFDRYFAYPIGAPMNHLAEHIMNVPAHKQTDPAKYPGQIVNPIPDAKTYKPAHGGYPGKVTR